MQSFTVPPAAAPLVIGTSNPVSPVWYTFFNNVSVTLGGGVNPTFASIAGTLAGSQSPPGVSTNSNAHIGYPGQYVSSTVLLGGAVALTSNVAANITSIPLSAGDWDIYGSVNFSPAGTTQIAVEEAGVSQTSATLPTPPSGGFTGTSATMPAGGQITLVLGHSPLSLAAPTTLYLVAYAVFTVSTCGAYGIIEARRSPNVY
jgi:hypothetical protein